MTQPTLPVATIVVGRRYRREMGDLQKLADSIRARGTLLHPIVVTTGHVLVAGERRLRACADILGWKDVPVHVVDIDSILLGERDENDSRKDLTFSERAALAEAIEAEIGDRRGRPPKRKDDGETDGENSGTCRQFPPGKKTAEAAAEAAGLGSEREYRRVKTAVRDGTPDLVEALDSGNITPSVAATLAHLPKPEQQEVLAKGPEAAREKAKEMREKVPPMPPEDPEAEERARIPERWHKLMHDLWRMANGLRDLGGMKVVSARWGVGGRRKAADELQKLHGLIGEWIQTLRANDS